jgi:hypothetical protein
MSIESEGRGVGMLAFSGILLVTMGIFRIFDGIWSISYHGSVPDNLQGGLFGTTLSTYGWVWVVIGILLILAGVGVFLRVQAARWFGVVAASVAAIAAVTWLPYYPVWALLYIYLAVIIIYALAVYGDRA